MQLLLLTVVLALFCGLQAQDEFPQEQDEISEEQDISGLWNMAAWASNYTALIQPGGPFRVFVKTLDMRDGNLHSDLLVPEEDQCKLVSLVAYKTNVENNLSLEYWGHNILSLVEVKSEEYLILYLINEHEGQTSLVANLMVRELPAKQEFQNRFESVCENLGLQRDQIQPVHPQDHCQKLTQ